MNSVIAKAKTESEARWLEDMAEAVEDYESEKDSCSDCVYQELLTNPNKGERK
jgi:uncharacterized protein Yka (UPF0111/DUF47 family)